MEVAVSPGEAALREMVTGNEIEGHFLTVAASLVQGKAALAEPKIKKQ